jgi:VWFA-related protein
MISPRTHKAALALALLPLLPAQSQAPAQSAPEMATHDATPTFSSATNLVQVPVIVRDKRGQAIGTLKKEDFHLFDKGKPQVISKFSIEKRGVPQHALTAAQDAAISDKTASAEKTASVMPDRFIAYLFDDVHLNNSDLPQVRNAASRQMTSSLQPTDRAAIFSTSGQTTLDYTDDRAQLLATLLRLQPRSKLDSTRDCPPMSYFMADAIQNRNDPQALAAAEADIGSCASLPPTTPSQIEQMVRGVAARALSQGDYETQLALNVIRAVIRRAAAMPGERSIVLISPGFFLTNDFRHDESTIMDLAIRSNVRIAALDARGLYTDASFDASRASYDINATRIKAQFEREAATLDGDTLAEFADATGGNFVHNTNDLEGGLNRVAAAPEFVYMLGFVPQNLKYDGSYHGLKVSLADPSGLNTQARRGYYAPRKMSDPKEQAKQDIEEAVFSREEMHDIPIELHTQFFKVDDDNAKLAVISRIDLRHLHYRKEEGRNRDDLTVVSVLFDRNGNYMSGFTKTLEMRLKDDTLETKLQTPITLKTSFDVKPGSYLLRLVVRDSEGQAMAAQNAVVEIP